jgi:putative heme-binding domain-containing protein
MIVNRFRLRGGSALLASLFLGCVASILSAAEPWTDTRLTFTNGLVVWFDVSRQSSARGAAGLTPLQSWNDAPDVLLDGSGNKRHLVQALLASRPKFRQEFNGAMLSFDGTNDFLAATPAKISETNLTAFLVAAPRSNAGFFRAFFGFSGAGQNDYTTGINFDLGGSPSAAMSTLNVEGAGSPGQVNLLTAPQPFGRWHLFTAVVGRGEKGVKLFLDGRAQGSRERVSNSVLRLDEFTLGARRYSNTPERPHVQGFFHGEFAEMLVFNRTLPDAERAGVEHYLNEKYGALLRGLLDTPVRDGATPLITVTNPPPIQMHVPGFAARELPIEISNINNLRYRPDGKLVAVAYDGRVWLLSDSDGDGLEDKAEPFWDKQTIRAPIGAALTLPNYERGQGVIVAGKGKVSLFLDTNRDDRADEEITVATWTEPSQQHGVDGLGVAVAPDGSVYFSLGAASFTEPYLIDKATGESRYRLTMDRGTIQRVAPDFSKRETVCTGIRFAVGMAFNHLGDLFCTDQEGATWRHDGNPFDELLHIQPGRHYGFPPRNPKHLPNVFDEPSVFDYTPQHQSTCGLQFNSAQSAIGNSKSEISFGPTFWKNDAIVSGYSRGKIWRTKLVKTGAGYVAQTHLLATVQALTVDATVSPRGDLIIATHSGQPDWGSGPTGKGKLWRVRYQDTNAPQPVATWNASATERCVAFDRPLKTEAVRELIKHARIESGKYVAAADRFETIRPGYQVVYDQLAAPRHVHEILSTQLSPDRRTLTLVTRPSTAAVNYAVTLPSFVAGDVRRLISTHRGNSESRDLDSYPEVDSLADLSGVEASWKSADGKESWSGWLPHLDSQVAREFTVHSAEHERLFRSLKKPGSLTMRGQLDLFQLLQPAIQPGAKIEWERPLENVKVRFESSTAFTARIGMQTVSSTQANDDVQRAEAAVRAPGKQWQAFEITVPTGADEPRLTATWSTDEDSRARAFPLRRFLLPWAQPADTMESTSAPAERSVPEIAGGNWLRGQRLFFGNKLACAKCHVIRGEGSPVGPELANLIHRDYASVRKDIQFPNAALNPDHVASSIELNDGDSVNGIIVSDKDNVIKLAMASGLAEVLPRARVKSIQPAQLSLMPEGLWEAMIETERRDLMTFLLTVPLEPYAAEPVIQGHKQPPARKRAEFAKFVPTKTTPHAHDAAAAESPAPSYSPLRIILCAAPKDPGHNFPGLHDYPIWRERWSKLLALADNVSVESADRWPSVEQWKRADVIAFSSDNPAWSAEKASDLDAFLARGGGLIFLHFAVNGGTDAEALAQRIGFGWGSGARFRHGAEEVVLAPHEITRDLPKSVSFEDETYWNLKPSGDATVLGTVVEEGAPRPQIWIREQGRGRVFCSILGHFTWTFDDPLYRVMLLRGFAWTAHQPLDRFAELIPIGARVQE